MIAGTTAYDTNVVALCNITAEWLRTDQTYSQRVSNLLNGGGLNGTTKLNATTVFDDTVGDNLNGNAGTDWFFAKRTAPNVDNVTPATGETVTTPGAPPAPLLAQGGARAEDGSFPALTNAQLGPIVEEAWLSRFVSRFTDLEDGDHPNQKIEVVLPGKGKMGEGCECEPDCQPAMVLVWL